MSREREPRPPDAAGEAAAEPARAEEHVAVSELVRAAAAPAHIDPADHEALLALALETGDDALCRPSDAERGEAETLRRALAGEGSHPLAELASALRAATAGGRLDELGHERVLRRALGDLSRTPPWRGLPSRRVALAALVAAAAGVALAVGGVSMWQGGGGVATAPAPVPELIPTRSTAALFDPADPFPRKGGESQRIDRIAAARAADLRANRFASWGVP
jgi:hypothetical protein